MAEPLKFIVVPVSFDGLLLARHISGLPERNARLLNSLSGVQTTA